ncbi:hypothetical protein SPRG_05820 [Saprolegnia parasitica CBS 223.65]|uniref:FH2 domain-containing protein n=1 Tax=Saprolegnia parasitica (strain CBS 223.65) TaxID=695850 RepID=A0A067CFM6_SAPPC|nr:hypothetical protein SPRG_05820 [Saprolegnia parasitica CBS 223.65]KDO29283.1 hypothetical protein SPRG_05820 [Saprolegnia parasitica CBS 223.65]|eukprot:XP_012199791.1 hypothetical protein SPRG_05820 [Saprolegnia parasitica CBS 223.65]
MEASDVLPTPASFLLQAIAMEILKVPRGERIDLPTQAPAHDRVLAWQFTVHAFDVGFRVEVDGAPCDQFRHRYQAADKLVEGILEDVPVGSHVVLTWDNQYSRLRSKKVSYRLLWTTHEALHAAREAANEYNIKYNNDVYRARSTSAVDRPKAFRSPRTTASHDALLQRLETAVVDTVSLFMEQPNVPLHAGAARDLVLALEAILRHGIHVHPADMYDEWPEEAYFGFLIQTRDVLRDDASVVADAQLFTPPPSMRYVGWSRARAFLFYALNRGLLHRALENLVKRRSLVDRYYAPEIAFLGSYARAKAAISLLSALHGVTFALAPLQDDLNVSFATFPPTLYMEDAMAPFATSELVLVDPIDAGDVLRFDGASDPDTFESIRECTPVRYLLLGQPIIDVVVRRSQSLAIPLMDGYDEASDVVLALQLRLLGSNAQVLVSLQCNEVTVSSVLTLSASTQWTELLVRATVPSQHGLSLLIDNRDTMVWSKHIFYRARVVARADYVHAWDASRGAAEAICWKLVVQRALKATSTIIAELEADEERLLRQQRPSTVTQESETSYSELLFGSWLGARSDAACGQCMEPFSLFRRAQECPVCLKQCCANCTRHVIPLPRSGDDGYVCDRCYLKALDSELATRQQRTDGRGENAALEALRQNPSMDKYFKMLSFGVPASAVGQKMQQDYIDADIIHVFTSALDPSGASTSAQSHGAAASSRTPMLLRKKSNLRKLHWTALDVKKVDVHASIWHRQTDKRRKAPMALSSSDLDRLVQLFGDNTTAKSLKKTSAKAGFSALDSRRSNNINIALSRFKSIAGGVHGVVAALAACDLSILHVDLLQTLDEIAPTPAEAKRYSHFRGKVTDPAEDFLIELVKQPRIAEKIKSLLYVVQYKAMAAALRQQLEAIAVAARDILQSERLPRYFEIVLALGNVLNEGTEHADASGVTLASLLKLSETRSMDQSITLLQYLMTLIHARGETDLFQILHEFASLETAQRYSNVLCLSQCALLQKGLANLKYEIKEEKLHEHVLRERAQQQVQKQQKQAIVRQNSVAPSGGRSALLSAIRRQASTVDVIAEGDEAPPRSALLAAIRLQHTDNTDEATTPQHALLAAIRQRAESKTESTSRVAEASPPADPRAALFAAIRKRAPGTEADVDNPRAALMAALRTPSPDSTTAKAATSADNPRSALMAALRQGQSTSAAAASPDPSATGGRHALLAAIRKETQNVPPTTPVPVVIAPVVLPFVTVMEKQAADIAEDLAKLQDDVTVMTEAWRQAAQYLGESPSSSSDYVLGLLYRFIMDVKVAYKLLVAKGHLPPAHASTTSVGDSIATVFGPAVVLAVRHAGAQIEVKLAWAQSAFLNPASILQPSDRVMCRLFGCGIVTATTYGRGLLSVRFPFGFATLRVDDILYRIILSSVDAHNQALEMRHGDPIRTPFGPATLLSVTREGAVYGSFASGIVHAFNPRLGHLYVHVQYVTFAC